MKRKQGLRSPFSSTPTSAKRNRQQQNTSQHISSVPPPLLLQDAAPTKCEVKVVCKSVVLGGYQSARKSWMEVDSEGSISMGVVTEEGGGARVSLGTSEIDAVGLTERAVVVKLKSVSGYCALHVNPDNDEKSTVLIELGDETHQNDLKKYLSPHSSLPTTVTYILECKLRLITAQSQSQHLKKVLATHYGDTLSHLTSSQLCEHRDLLISSIQCVQAAIDARLSEAASKHLCICCTEYPSTILLMPCKHLVLCNACFEKLSETGACVCPVCRAEAVEHTVVFLS
eukprot:TRINITY_DN27816_c0_g1_i1.p1 TRINITY_DN27816_c0_g1~~TRINITY_DN27816_c0_g1_i1.p1  ORF type:complete len:303 (+),score=40.32 TRINITY_DN27816_c0_g1_i1:57-911(+)